MVKKKESTTAEILTKEEADLVTNYIITRWNKGLYSLILVAGLPGTGKSSLCMRMSELIYLKKEGVNKMKVENVMSNLLELTNFVMKANPDELNIAVVEEVSVLFPSKRAMSGGNVDLGMLLDTCRKKKVILFANAPIWTSIDSHMRTLGNVYIQTKKIYKKAKIVLSKMYRLQTDPRTGKTYTPCFKRNGRKVKKMYTRMPNLKEWSKYENRKDIFMDTLYKKLKVREQKRIDKDTKLYGDDVKKTQIKPLTNRELNTYHRYYVEKKTQNEIAKEDGVSIPAVCLMLKRLNLKLQVINKNTSNK